MHFSVSAGATWWLVVPLLALAVACGDEGKETRDPCRDVVCLVGQDCVAGECVDRPGDGGSGGGGAGGAGGCRSAADCAFDPAGPLCDTGRGVCVECLGDGHCDEGERCRQGVCEGGCKGDADCPGATPRCRVETGACVACLGDGDCGEGEACRGDACVPETIGCASDGDCVVDPTRPRCRLTGETGICVACLGGGDCGEGEECVADACVSVSCASDDDCAGIAGLPRCDREAGRCVGCLADTDCADGEMCVDRGCEPAPGCEGDDDCVEATRPVCDGGTCRGCAGDGECAEPTPRCAPTGDCRGCLGDGDCGAGAPRCSPAGVCVGCLEDGDCAFGEDCEAGVCVRPAACTGDEACAGGFVCDRGACVACRSDAECPRGTCVAGGCVDRASCVSDTDCATGLCAGGTCVACAGDLDCRPGLWCEAGACVEAGVCAFDRECTAGRTCVAGVCTPASCADDRNEPDSGPHLARPHAPGLPTSGVLCPNDEDWLAVAAGAGAGLEATLIAPPTGTSLSLVWYDAATGALREKRAPGEKLEVRSLPAAAAGRYFLRIGSDGHGGSYTVLAQVRPTGGACADRLEPNDTRAAARAVEPGVWVEDLTLCGDDDFYAVNVPAGRTLAAYAFFLGGDLRLETFTQSGSRIETGVSTSFRGGGKVAHAGPAPSGGATYLVRASASGTPPATYELYFSVAEDPACRPAPALIGIGQDRGRASGTTVGRGADRGDTCGGGGPDANHVIHLGAEAGLSAVARGDFDVRLLLMDGACGETLSCAPAVGGEPALDLARLPAGQYTLVVGGAPGAAGTYEVAARLLPPADPPPNDRCVAAELLDVSAGAVHVSGSTRGAGAEHDASCAGPSPEVFYRFGLAAPARVIVDLTADLPVWLDFANAACASAGACSPAVTVHRLDVTLPGGDHLLAVGSATGAAAAFELSLVLPPAVGNDTCAGATPLSVPGTVSGDTTWAKNDLEFPDPDACTGYYTGGGEVFHALTLASGQSITATLTPDAWDAALYLIADCAAPACLAGVDAAYAGGPETLAFTAPAAGTYRLVVDGVAAGGPYTLEVQ